MPWWAVVVIGLVIAALASGAIFYFAIRPQQEQIQNLQKQIQEKESIIARRQQAEEELKKAEQEAEEARKRWEIVRKELVTLKLPDLSDPASLWRAVLDFQAESGGYFERDLRKYLAELATKHNLELYYPSVPTVQLASLQPSALAGMVQNSYFRWGQMTLQVDGRFGDILKFIKELPYFTRPIVVQIPVQTPMFQLLPSGKVRAIIPIEVYALVETHEGKPLPSQLAAAPAAAGAMGGMMPGGMGPMGGPMSGPMGGPGMGAHGGPMGAPMGGPMGGPPTGGAPAGGAPEEGS
jgi:ABC-type multidrug transport system fused ATPase/permease subunit